MSEFISKDFKDFEITFVKSDKTFQLSFDGHIIHADTITYSSHAVFDIVTRGIYIGYLNMRSEEKELKQFLKKVL